MAKEEAVQALTQEEIQAAGGAGDTDNFGDVSKLSNEDLKNLAFQAFDEADNKLDDLLPEKPRDEKGRFAKKAEDVKAEEPEEVVEETQEEPDEYVLEEVIEVGDNGPRQVFRGKGATELEAQRDLNRKLAEAQRNATKKIREQEARVKSIVPKDDFKSKEYTSEEEFIVSQEMMQNPSKAFRKMFKDITGYEPTEFRSTVEASKAVNQAREETQATESFLTSHPLYETSPKNGERMTKWMQRFSDPKKSTQENLEAAYDDLSGEGLLTLKEDAGNTDQPTAKSDTQRIAETAEAGATQRTSTTTKKSSSIKQTSRSTAPAVKDKSFEEKNKNLSLDELRSLAYQHADEFLAEEQ
jgi:hypothetical protein